MAELTTPSLANMRSMMAELFVWKEQGTVLKEEKEKDQCKAYNIPSSSRLKAEGSGGIL